MPFNFESRDAVSASTTNPDSGVELSGSVHSVQVGQVAALGPQEVSSGFVKRPVRTPVAINPRGLEGDAQADLTVHGGRDKAVYLYPYEHYHAWREDLPEHEATLVPGGFGENLTTVGFNERTTCIGDVFRAGSALLQVTQFRQPCFKLAVRFGDNRLPRAMLKTGRSGWYARVIGSGMVQQGNDIVLTSRPNPTWSVERLMTLFINHSASVTDLVELSQLPGLARHWQRSARQSLEEMAPQSAQPSP